MKDDYKHFFTYHKWLLRALPLLYAVGIVLHLLPATVALAAWVTPWFLFLCGVSVLLLVPAALTRRWLLWLLLTPVLTLAAEIIGVQTGVLFGDYNYGPVLGIRFYGVPLLIAFNWLLVICGSLNLAALLTRQRFLQILLTGGFAFVFDFIMEPVAIRLGYWHWEGDIIPVKNYITWTALALLIAIIYHLLDLKQPRKTAAFYLAMQALFFGCLWLFFSI